jgi:hypothetical protein
MGYPTLNRVGVSSPPMSRGSPVGMPGGVSRRGVDVVLQRRDVKRKV